MKKLFFTISFFSFFAFCFGQQNKKEIIRTASDLKTGKSQDVLASFFQLAFDDITGNNKAFKFQSSIFAIKAKTDPNLFIDTNYLKQRFARNFVISISPAFDTGFKFKSNTLGLKYAIVNNRDKSIFDFVLPSEDDWVDIEKKALNTYKGQSPDSLDFIRARNYFLDEDDENDKKTAVKDLPPAFRAIMLELLSKNERFKQATLESFQNKLSVEYAELARYVENRALWTIDGNFSSDNNGKLFSRIMLNSEYLKGILNNNSNMGIELNLKATLLFDDDTATIKIKDLNRQLFSFSGGFNWIIIKNKRKQSIVELRGALAYYNVLKGVYTSEKRSQFIGEGTLRVRVTNDIWIPLDIRYDPEKGNVFGFLSVRSNFDWLKPKQ